MTCSHSTKITLLPIRSLSWHFGYLWLLQKAQTWQQATLNDVIKKITLMPFIVQRNYKWFCVFAVVKLKWIKKAPSNFDSQQQPPYKTNQSSYLFFLIRPARARMEMDVYIKCSVALANKERKRFQNLCSSMNICKLYLKPQSICQRENQLSQLLSFSPTCSRRAGKIN